MPDGASFNPDQEHSTGNQSNGSTERLYLEVTLDTWLNLSPHIALVMKRTAQRMGNLGPLPNRMSDLSVKNGVLVNKQLICPMMYYACPAWRSAARGYKSCNPSVLDLLRVSAPLYLRHRQIREDLAVPLYADHIRALTGSFDSKLGNVENPLVRQLGRHLRWPRVDPVAWVVIQGRQEPAGQSRPSPAMAKSTKRIALGADQPSAFRLLWLRFSWFSSVKRQITGYTIWSRGMARTPLRRRGGIT